MFSIIIGKFTKIRDERRASNRIDQWGVRLETADTASSTFIMRSFLHRSYSIFIFWSGVRCVADKPRCVLSSSFGDIVSSFFFILPFFFYISLSLHSSLFPSFLYIYLFSLLFLLYISFFFIFLYFSLFLLLFFLFYFIFFR